MNQIDKAMFTVSLNAWCIHNKVSNQYSEYEPFEDPYLITDKIPSKPKKSFIKRFLQSLSIRHYGKSKENTKFVKSSM
jgi:hypothetical protein